MSGGAHHPKVLPQWQYRDPSEFVRFPSETACTGCRQEVHVMGTVQCLIGRKHSSQGGQKCKRFKLEVRK